MKQQPKKSGGYASKLFLLAVIAAYGVLAFLYPDKTALALDKSVGILKQIIPILLVVLFLTALLNTLVQPKKIAKYLGKESGLKGWAIALAGGLLSHGPSYIWYPILADIRQHGVKNGLMVAFFYAKAIKLPWLPMMISYFGLLFTLVLTLYILAAALLQGAIAEKLLAEAPEH